MTFDPEIRERKETYREKQMISPEMEEKIREKLAVQETYPDIVYCPNRSCGTPVEIVEEQDSIALRCKNCGFDRIIPKKKKYDRE
jgi:hypothetical protein